MFEAADPAVFAWYVKNYVPDVNLFIDHSQIVQLEALRRGIWETKDLYWPVYVSNQNMRPSTLDSYNSALKKWIRPYFDDMRLEEITPRTVTEFMGKKLIPANLASKDAPQHLQPVIGSFRGGCR